MREARWKTILNKSVSACVAAIEIYNKPVMPHREEAFSMLAVNAWELLLKARLVKEGGNSLRSIYVFASLKTKNGAVSRKRRIERNRAGNPKTITFGEAVHRVSNLPTMPLDPACLENLWSLVEVRDNAVHLVNDDADMARSTYAAGCGCLRNYATAVAEWFNEDLSKHRFMILPLSFEGVGSSALAIRSRRSRQAANLIAYLERAAGAYPMKEGNQYASSIRVETRIVGTKSKDATAFRLGGGPDAPKVALTEEGIADRFPLDYANLQQNVKKRMPELKFNKTFNAAVDKLKSDSNYAFRRRLDPRDPKCSTAKIFYSNSAVDALCKIISGTNAS